MTKLQLQERVQVKPREVVDRFARDIETPNYWPEASDVDIRLHEPFRRMMLLRNQISAHLIRTVNADLQSDYNANLQELLSQWA